MQRLLMLGLSHATAPLAVREKLALGPGRDRAALEAMHGKWQDAEVVVLSTCNRVELYTARALHGHPRAEELIGFLSEFNGVGADQFRAHLYEKKDREAVGHLFSVAASLDSMVVGETQILGQVREAYDLARSVGVTGGLLNPLFQRALAVGKQVMSQTAVAEGRLSVASAAVDYARRIFERFDDKTVVNIGAGKMAGLVLANLHQTKPRRLIVCNRDAQKAAELAAKFGGEAAALDDLAEPLTAADIVVCSTGAPEPIITRALLEPLRRKRKYRPLFIIDIAVPRDAEERVQEFDEVYLCNLDHLQQVVGQTQRQRGSAVEAARQIVREQVEEFASWHRAREMGATIDALYKEAHQLAHEELERTLARMPEASAEERAHMEELTRRIVNKLLHGSVKKLRE